MPSPKFLIVDGSSLVYRAFFALPLLQTKQGLYTNAVYGFTTMLLRLLEEEKPDYAVVAFDRLRPPSGTWNTASTKPGGKRHPLNWPNRRAV
jgi:5'-3' exonuclease